jgi:pimeloyl-ACP methyl ester carboxylesterase
MKTKLYLLSGLICDDTVWQAQLDGLADIAEVQTVDFQGFDNITLMAEHVLAMAPMRFAVAGHSMGARVALEIMRLAPERVERLALLDTGTHAVRPGEQQTRQELLDLAHEHGMPALADRWLPPMMSPANASRTAFCEPLRAMVCRMSVDTFAGQIRALLQRPDASDQLSSIRCPVLIGVGAEDRWSTVAQHEQLADSIRHAAFEVYPGAGHMAPYEAPAAVTDSLRRWLQFDPIYTYSG